MKSRHGQIMAGAVLALGLVLVPTVSASAAPTVPSAPMATPEDGVPIGVLGDCIDGLPNSGGWSLRRFLPRSSNEETDLGVRPRNLTLGEPCVASSILRVPFGVSEVPVEGWDGTYGTVLDPGNDLPFPGDGPCWYAQTEAIIGTVATSTYTGTPGDYSLGCAGYEPKMLRAVNDVAAPDKSVSFYGHIASVTLTGSAVKGASIDYVRDEIVDPAGNAYLAFRALCKSVGTTAGWAWSTSTTVTDSDATATRTVTCPTDSGGRVWQIEALYSFDYYPFHTTQRAGVFWTPSGHELDTLHTTVGGRVSSYAQVGSTDFAGVDTDVDTYIVCKSTAAGEQFQLESNTVYKADEGNRRGPQTIGVPYMQGDDEKWSDSTEMVLGNWTTETCPRIVQIYMVVCVWLTNGPDGYVCSTTEWNAAKWANHSPYDDTPGEDGNLEICSLPEMADRPECEDILYPPYQDPTDFGSVCAGAPAPVWLDFTWLPSFIGHYVDCLWNPKGGWDHDGTVAAAVEASSVTHVLSTLEEVGQSFVFSDSCGTLISADILGSPLTIDTCAWSWATPIKDLLTAGIWIAFGVWLISFVVKIIIGLPNRKTPNPLGDDS